MRDRHGRRKPSFGDRFGWIGYVVLFVLILALIGFAVVMRFTAPCKDLGWMPVKDLPARCLTFVRTN
jgi:hypothetical protein